MQYRRDAISVADVDRGFGTHTLCSTLQRADTPLLNLIEVDVEARFVELNDVAAIVRQLAGFLVEQPREIHREGAPAAVILISERIGRRHRTRQSDFHRLVGITPKELQCTEHSRTRAPQWTGHPRGIDHHAVAIAAGLNLDQAAVIDPFEPFAKSPDVMPPPLLAIGQDAQSRFMLVINSQPHGVVLPLAQYIVLQAPLRVDLAGLGEPRRAREAANNHGLKHLDRSL